ncbi:DUF427 domain-containing protein [Aurantiacibacter spongiae]|uniref:DUF427 domain-containing protein n=1 Tax=Aurantiacibacter spongiae TaxID=2488860 RepID=A0A3N5DBR3_9SPHN|nr:DUF427 domain-containing protein [Aurantiacibacter spongiae]RPF72208.1 DUF427 domain-containing protein [Aurantiacibacter spongiae]
MGQVTARWNGVELVRSDDTIVVEGNHYFPPADVDRSLLVDSDTTTTCPWKGEASYFSVVANGDVNTDAAWVYRDPKPDAETIRDRIAFWKGVDVSAE